MTWYLILTGFVAVLGVFTLWLKRKDSQAPVNQVDQKEEYAGDIED